MRTIITMPDYLHAQAKQRAAELGISFAEFARRLFERELGTPALQGNIESVCGMVTGAPFDMARDGDQIIAEATDRLLTERRG